MYFFQEFHFLSVVYSCDSPKMPLFLNPGIGPVLYLQPPNIHIFDTDPSQFCTPVPLL